MRSRIRDTTFSDDMAATVKGKSSKPEIIEVGHYVDLPVVRGERTLEVSDGEIVNRVYVIGRESEEQERLSDSVVVVSRLPFDNIVVGSDAMVRLTVVILPGNSIRLPLRVDMTGENADVAISGLFVCSGEDVVDIHTDVRHRVPSCKSYQLFNGIAGGSAKSEFVGRIVVAPDAQKTEAYQTNHNIVLTASAHAETRPQLEIYADDVKCSHGATVGRLNDDEQFYMQSRGIPEEEAKVLQMVSFVAPVLSNVENAIDKEVLDSIIEKAIRSL